MLHKDHTSSDSLVPLDPIPVKNYCDACNDSFNCYQTHISSLQHQYKLCQVNSQHYAEIDLFFENLNQSKDAPTTERLLEYYKKQSRETENLINKMRKTQLITPLVPKFIKESPR